MDCDAAIAKILKAEGVEWMAAFPMQTLIDAAAKEGIRPIVTRQERAGVNMADGVFVQASVVQLRRDQLARTFDEGLVNGED